MKRLYYIFLVLLNTNSFSTALEQPINSNSVIEIISDQVKYKADINKISFNGKVIATQKDLKLYCDRMEVLFEGKQSNNNESNNKLKTILLFGNVEIITLKEKAFADKGIYEVSNEKLILQENVRLEQDNNILRGDELIYFKAKGESILQNSSNSKQRVRGTFTTKSVK